MDFFDLLVRYETELWNHLEDRLRDGGGVSLATLSALRVVDHHDRRARVQDVRADLRITVGAASKLVDRLERDGLATRRPHPDDRRSSLVELTPAGRDALATGTALLDGAMREHLGEETAAALAAATEVLGRLDARLTAAAVTA
jgi:DNA-binding MarR family transcriptional regulator